MSRRLVIAGFAAAMALASPAVLAADVTVRVLDRAGALLPDAVVMIETTQPGAPPERPAALSIGQEKMRFVPAISVVTPGTRVTFTNNDSWDHHVRGGLAGPGDVFVDASTGFELRLAGRTTGQMPASAPHTFTKAGPHLIGCHIHSSMRGYVYVSESPWASLTGVDGQATLARVPDGPARVRVWVPGQLVDPPPVAVTVASGMAVVSVPTQAAPPRRRSN